MGTAGQSVTLANSIIGVGILAMPFCFQQCGALLAALMLLLSSFVSRISCYFLLKSAIIARKRNFEFLAFHVFGPTGKMMVEIAIIGFLMGTCIAYFVVVGDLGPQIISKMFNINQSDFLRTCVMLLISILCVLPLGLLRNVDSLSNVSAATIGFYFCLIIKIMTEATSQLLNGDWRSKVELWKPEGVLQCVPIFSMALFCQTQLFEIFEALPSISLEKMNLVTKNAINTCTLVYLMVGMFGYVAFCGQHISGNILVSLSATMASDVIKLGFVMSLAFSFPLIIFPLRASLYSLMYRKVVPSHHDHIINHSIPESTFRCITVGIIAISLFISLLIPTVELVLGLVGSTIGVMICVVFPSAVFVNLTVKNTNERLLAKIILCLGLIIMVLGTYANLEAAETEQVRYDEKYITPEKIDQIVENFMKTNEKYNKQDQILKVKAPDIKSDNGIVKESAAQPPNPVAPELDISPKPEFEKPIDVKPAVVVKKPENVENVNNEIEGAGDKENVLNNKISGETNEQIEKKTKDINEDAKEPSKNENNQDKIKLLKQQQLIETIKQHGEEQKELIKEQKEILDKLEKTKKELEDKKLEEAKKEVNKIAVESIQEIAKLAIQKISDVESEGKLESYDKKNENDIIKALVEDVKEKISQDDKIISNKVNDEHEGIPNEKEVNIGEHNEIIKESHVSNNKDEEIPQTKEKYLPEPKSHVERDDLENKKVVPQANEHVHSIDEPKSYVQGEDSEKNKSYMQQQKMSISKKEALLNNVPVPVVMSQNFQNEVKKSENRRQLNENNSMDKNGREKREVEKCVDSEVNRDPRICEQADKREFMGDNIDLKIPEKLSAPTDIKLDTEQIHGKFSAVDIIHQSRALKSLNETDHR